MSRDWKESKQRSVHLPNDDPYAFELYLYFLYRGRLPAKPNRSEPAAESEELQLAKAYVLGDRLQDGDFQDFIIDVMIK
jgi:hypothetical protein